MMPMPCSAPYTYTQTRRKKEYKKLIPGWYNSGSFRISSRPSIPHCSCQLFIFPAFFWFSKIVTHSRRPPRCTYNIKQSKNLSHDWHAVVRNGCCWITCNSKLWFYYSILHSTRRYGASQGSRPNLVGCWERLGIYLLGDAQQRSRVEGGKVMRNAPPLFPSLIPRLSIVYWHRDGKGRGRQRPAHSALALFFDRIPHKSAELLARDSYWDVSVRHKEKQLNNFVSSEKGKDFWLFIRIRRVIGG